MENFQRVFLFFYSHPYLKLDTGARDLVFSFDSTKMTRSLVVCGDEQKTFLNEMKRDME
jgi:hypothetical protein